MKQEGTSRLLFMKRVFVRKHEKGLYFYQGEFMRLIEPGRYWFCDPLGRVRVDIASSHTARFEHPDLETIEKSGVLKDHADVYQLDNSERGLVWIDGRFNRILLPGLHVYWKGFHQVDVEIVPVGTDAFTHTKLPAILDAPCIQSALDVYTVQQGSAGVLIENGRVTQILTPGRYAFWKGVCERKCEHVDLREQTIDVAGQEIMTADKVTLRLNAVITYRIDDLHKLFDTAHDPHQALYREAQLALRALVGGFELEALLNDKTSLSGQLEAMVGNKAAALGLVIRSAGIRDIILPGDMKSLLNKVMEARKAAEANLITRREETAAMRSQVNTAQLIDKHPTLMRLRELDMLAKVAEQAKLSVVLGEKGLTDRVVNLL